MTLSSFEQRWAQAIGRALFPAGVFGGARDGIDLGAELNKSAATYPIWSRLVLHLSLWMVWWSPLFLGLGPKSFGSLPASAREAVLERLLASPIYLVRQEADFLKLYLCVVFIGDRGLLQRLGAYDLGPLEAR
jgi:hypothetical protein